MATPVFLSILIGIVSAVVAGTIVHVWQVKRAAVFPSIPSRVETVDHDDAVVRYFGAAHDITNTITSAWNHARATKADDTMLRELELPVLGEKIELFREAEAELTGQLQEHERLNDALARIRDRLEQSWSYNRLDHYRTEVYFTTDAKGKGVMRTRQVYTHTTHDFSFHPEAAGTAEHQLTALLNTIDESELYDAAIAHLDISFTDDDRIRVWETVLEGRDEKPTDQEVFAALDEWNEAARGQHDIATAIRSMRLLRRRATPSTFRQIRQSRSHYHYVSYGGPGSSHAGPRGYQATGSLLEPSSEANDALTSLFSAIRASDKHVSEIHRSWKEQGRFTEEDPGNIARDMLDNGVELYRALFPKSKVVYDQRVKRGRTIAIAVAAGVVAGLAAYLILVV